MWLAPRRMKAPQVDHFPSGRLVYFLSGARTGGGVGLAVDEPGPTG